MPSLLKIGRIIAQIGIFSLAMIQWMSKTYLIGRPTLPGWLSGKTAVYALIIVFSLIAFGMTIQYKRHFRRFAFFMGVFIFVVSFLLCHVAEMMHKDASGILWQLNAYKTLALAGGCWIVAASVPGPPAWLNNKILVITGWVTMAIWLVIAGAAHMQFNGFVQDFIPAYIPWHAFWSYFTAAALLAGGIGLLINPLRRWAALLSGLMILLWFFLLHIPRAAANPTDIAEWLGVCESFIFSGMLFVLASLTQKQTS